MRSLLSNLVYRNLNLDHHVDTLLRMDTRSTQRGSTRSSRTQAVRKRSLQVAGLQVHATTLS